VYGESRCYSQWERTLQASADQRHSDNRGASGSRDDNLRCVATTIAASKSRDRPGLADELKIMTLAMRRRGSLRLYITGIHRSVESMEIHAVNVTAEQDDVLQSYNVE